MGFRALKYCLLYMPSPSYNFSLSIGKKTLRPRPVASGMLLGGC